MQFTLRTHRVNDFTRSVTRIRVRPLLNCHIVPAPQTLLQSPSSRIQIALLDIKGGIRNVLCVCRRAVASMSIHQSLPDVGTGTWLVSK